MTTLDIAKNSKIASIEFRSSSADERNYAIREIARSLTERMNDIISENNKDVEEARKQGLTDAMIDRLTLTENRIQAIIDSVQAIADQEEVVGQIISQKEAPNGLKIQRQRIPLGTIAMIFESRPNVVIDCSCLAIKSGNSIILKGGKEAKYSNNILSELVREAISRYIPKNVVQLVSSKEAVSELLKLKDYIDVVIPRGGEKLIQYVYDNAKMPVIAHFKGLCHIYVHKDADLKSAKEIILNAKVQRPGVCNAMESLLLHHDLPKDFVTDIIETLLGNDVEIFADEAIKSIDQRIKLATNKNYATEYLDKKLSVKTVGNEKEAIEHIQSYGSQHTEAILAKDERVIQEFQNKVDASCIMVNASTRFNDGGELGLGAELGISTTKFHSYGPMGAAEMTTTRFVVVGQGQIRA
ncbi:MAG: glutamate-5-semialdehyde dehydrogenase [Halobacteriovoraceae bacterium]|nr:glutamate-5-semialdehyde dehydrogenase [Halobacteriovoraceae bacterium]